MVKLKKIRDKLSLMYWSAVAVISGTMISVQPVMADTIWNRFSSTIVAVTVAAIALVVRMVSRNQRAVDEATAWLKRIVITWIILNSLGFVVTYLQPLISGGNYNG